MKTESALTGKNAGHQSLLNWGAVFGLRQEVKRHAALEGRNDTRKAVSPLRSATAVQNVAALRPWSATSQTSRIPRRFFRSAGGPRPQRFANGEMLRISDAFSAVHRLRPGTGRAPLLAPLLLCAFALIPFGLSAATNDLSGLLQKGLFEEEANRNLEAAAQAYQTVSAQFDKDRKLAATAIFRLGEIYRKQGKTNEAAGQYERIVREFADQDTLVTLSRQNLVGLGGAAQTRAAVAANIATADNLQSQYALLKAQLEQARKETNVLIITKLLDDADLRETLQNARTLIRTPEDQQNVFDAATARALDYAEKRLSILQSAIAQARLDQSPTTAHEEASPSTDDEEKEIRRIQAMIKNSPDLINAAGGGDSMTPLSRAASRGQLRVAAFLLDHGADINLDTPLRKASSSGHKAMVEFLLTRGADVNATVNGQTALQQAAEYGFLSVTEALLAGKADPNVRDVSSQSPLTLADKRGSLPVAAALLANGADPNVVSIVQPGYGTNPVAEGRKMFGAPLHFSAARGDAAMTTLLLSNRADVKVLSIYNETPLDVAAVLGKTKVAELLLAAGADPNARRFADAGMPLVQAVWSGNREVVELLLEHGANPNVTVLAGQAGVTPLMIAAGQKDPELVSRIIYNFG